MAIYSVAETSGVPVFDIESTDEFYRLGGRDSGGKETGGGSDGVLTGTRTDHIQSADDTRIEQVQTGNYHTDITRVESPEDVAQVVADLGAEPQENFIALVLDGEGTPCA